MTVEAKDWQVQLRSSYSQPNPDQVERCATCPKQRPLHVTMSVLIQDRFAGAAKASSSRKLVNMAQIITWMYNPFSEP